MSKLRISQDLSLPLETQTSTLVVYGGKGMGKTNFGSVLVEELAKQRLRFSVIDPLDVWWGLQHGATKDTRGLDVVILGGPRGDIPIEPSAGAVVADFVADEPVSTVIVLRKSDGAMWTSAERVKFVTAYAGRLFQRQGENRIPLLQVIDEAGRFVPQLAQKGDRDIAECVSAIEQLVEWGRNVGVGVALLTQRSARMAKAVSELADCMVAFRTVGPNSVGAIVDWFGEHVPKERQKELVEQVRKLDRGTALVVSPGWLGFEGTARMRARETFDSSSTPAPGKSLRAPGQAQKPDLEKYRTRMAETIARAKADDPKALRARIAELERELLHAKARAIPPSEDQLAHARAQGAHAAESALEAVLTGIGAKTEAATKALERVAEILREPIGVDITGIAVEASTVRANTPTLRRVALATARAVQAPARGRTRPAVQPVTPRRAPLQSDTEAPDVGAGALRMLRILAQYAPAGLPEGQWAALAGLKRSGGTCGTYVSRLRTRGLLERRGDLFYATDAGVSAAGEVQGLPTTAEELIDLWRGKTGMRPVIPLVEAVVWSSSASLTRAELAEACGLTASGGTFSTYLSRARTAGLLADSGDALVPGPAFDGLP